MLVTASQQTKGPLESKTYKLVGLSVAQLRTSLTLPLAAAFNHTHQSRHSLWINTTLVLRAICKVDLHLDEQFQTHVLHLREDTQQRKLRATLNLL